MSDAVKSPTYCCQIGCTRDAEWAVIPTNERRPDAPFQVECCSEHLATIGLTLHHDNPWIAAKYPCPSFTVWSLSDWKYD